MIYLPEPFPLTSRIIMSAAKRDLQRNYDEYLYNIKYHSLLAASAWNVCNKLASIHDFTVLEGGRAIQFTKVPPAELVMHGDIAVREFSSALDAALLLTNFITDTQVEPKKVNWNSRSEKKGMRGRLRERGEKADALIQNIDYVFKSIGYFLMNEYRNWVTHRGSPKFICKIGLGNRFTVPEAVGSNHSDPARRHNVDLHAAKLIYDSVQIVCHRFRAPVEGVYTKTFGPDDQDIELGGHIIGKNAGRVHMEGVRFSIGSMMDDADEYQARNPNWIGEDTANVAGEQLTVYTLNDYLHALRQTGKFYSNAVTGSWDTELVD